MIQKEKPWLSNWVELWKSDDLEIARRAEKRSKLDSVHYDRTLMVAVCQRTERASAETFHFNSGITAIT
jgi:hypothetical protein